MKPVIYVIRSLPGGHVDALRERFEVRGEATRPPERDELIVAARPAVVLVPTYLDRVDDALLAELPHLRHVASYGVGVNHIDLTACRRRGLVVTNTPGVLTNATADHTFGLLLAAARRIAESDRFVRAGLWKEIDPQAFLGTEVSGKTLGIVGFGRIGQAVARRAVGFDMPILYSDENQVAFPGARRCDLDELLAESDFVSLHVPLTPQTQSLLSRARIARMKRGAILVNTARGGVVDEEALCEALREGRLGAAGLDVYEGEPQILPSLRSLDSVVLTPHIGSGSREARGAMARLVVEDVLRVAAGQPARHPVVPE
jgi:glyoxylate reductase